jgi:hypothetical protein
VVLKYDGVGGAFLGVMVQAGAGGLDIPLSLAFGPDGALYVLSPSAGLLRYHPTTGAFLDAFLTDLGNPRDFEFSADGRVIFVAEGADEAPRVSLFDASTGEFLDAFDENLTGYLGAANLELHSNGTVYVSSWADQRDKTISRYAPVSTAVFTATLSSVSGAPVTATFRTTDITAQANSDYIGLTE